MMIELRDALKRSIRFELYHRESWNIIVWNLSRPIILPRNFESKFIWRQQMNNYEKLEN